MGKYIIPILIVLILLSGCSVMGIGGVTRDKLDIIARPPLNGVEKHIDNWYLFHEDRIYVYNYTPQQTDEFYSVNLQGKDKKIISKSEDLRLAELYMIHNNHAYYYTTYNQGIKKINIKTGGITNLVDGMYLYLIPDTLEGNTVVAVSADNYINYENVYIARLNLETGELIEEKTLKYGSNYYYLSKSKGKVYHITQDIINNNNLVYEDNKLIYEYPYKTNNQDIIIEQDGEMYIINKQEVQKLSKEKGITDKRAHGLGELWMYSNVRMRNHMFKQGELTPDLTTMREHIFRDRDGLIYKLDTERIELIPLTKADDGFIQEKGNLVIIQGLTETVIYNKITGETKTYQSSNSTVGKEIYLMTFKGDFYYQRSNICEFKVKKIGG